MINCLTSTLCFKIVYFSIVISFGANKADPPPSVCYTTAFPYKTMYGSCSSFDQVCLKKDNPECNNILNICSQCPLSNNSFIDNIMIKMDSIQNQTNGMEKFMMNKIESLQNQMNNIMIKMDSIQNQTNVATAILIIIVIFIVAIITIRLIMWCIINKKFECLCDPENFRVLSNGYSLVATQQRYDSTHNQRLDIILNLLRDESGRSKLDNVIQFLAKTENQLLRIKINIEGGVEGVPNIPSEILVKPDQTISQLKKDISNFFTGKDFRIIKDDELFEENKTVEECNLKDADCIRVIIEKNIKLTIISLFEEGDCYTVEFRNIERVSDILHRIAARTCADENNFILLLEGNYLDKNKYIFQYNINNQSTMKYYCLIEPKDVEIESEFIDEGCISKLYRAEYRSIGKKRLFIEKYNLTDLKIRKNNLSIFNQLKTFEITKSNKRFVKLLGIYKDSNYYYVAMEDQDEKTLTMFLKEYPSIEEPTIAEWSCQAMDGLQFLHKNNFIYRNLMPYEVLIDKDQNLKLNSFCLSKFTPRLATTNIMQKMDPSKQPYLAPEINEKPSKAVDVWSLGVLIIWIVLGKCPSFDQIKNISKELPSKTSDDLRAFIESCVKQNPEERPTIDKLLHSDFIKKYKS